MPRYFFHAADGEPVPDVHGSNLADDEAARGEALRYAGELLKWSPGLLTPRNQLRVEVMNESGAMLFTVVTVLVEVPQIQRLIIDAAANDE